LPLLTKKINRLTISKNQSFDHFLVAPSHKKNTVRNGCRTCFPSLDVFAHRVKADQFAFAHLDEREVVFLKPRS